MPPRREWLPEGSLYVPYLVAINRPGLGVAVVGLSAGDLRFGLLRVNPRTAGGRSWQLGLEAGL